MVKQLPRLKSGVTGLDVILGGGLVEGASYIFQGRPGAGKTILSNQIAFAQAREGHRVLFVTLLAETHDRLFQSLATFDFFEPARLGNEIAFVSVFQTLRDEGLPAVVNLLRKETQRQSASLLIFDGLLNARDLAETGLDVKTFIAAVQGQAAFVGCTVLFLSSEGLEQTNPEHTMVDGVIDLAEHPAGVRTVRRLQVRKFRGSATLGGFHQFDFDTGGIAVYPRLESVLAYPSAAGSPEDVRDGSGVPGFDELIGGGLPRSSVTMIMGPSGSGKTSFGLSFLKLATPEEPALHFGFYETPGRLEIKARALGIDFDDLVRSGALEVVWRPLTENLLDKLGHDLLDAVRRRGVKRLFIDSLGGFERAAIHQPRLVEFFSALTNELRALGVTTLATWEMQTLFGSQVSNPSPEMSSIVDNLLMLRQAELRSELRRVLCLIKVRDSLFDPALQEILISGQGVAVKGRLEAAEGAVTGLAHPATG